MTVSERLSLDGPALLLVMGVPGVGKTTLSKALLRKLVCTYLDNNFIADAFFPATRTDEEYKRLRPRLYDVLYRVVLENLSVGNTVLLDVPHVTHMGSAKWRRFIRGMCAATKAKLIVIRCACRESALRSRLRRRGEARDAWKLENWKAFMEKEPIGVRVPFPHIDIDTGRPTNGNADAALQYIGKRMGGGHGTPAASERRRR